MKKLLILSFVTGMLILASCGSRTTTEVKVVEKQSVDTLHKAAADTTVKK